MKTRPIYQKHEQIQRSLERAERFNRDYIPFGTHWVEPNGNFRYRQTFLHRVGTVCIRTVLQIFAPPLIRVVYGARVTGKRNLKAIKNTGAICVCNHFCNLDTLFVRQAVGHYRSYHTIAPQNNKTGLGGAFMRHGGLLPFSGNHAATRNLTREMERLLKEKKIINFYAEQAMWTAYQKPRPMKRSAFFYATKFDVPVVPIFCTFDKTRRGRIKKLRINVLEPVFPDPNLNKQARTDAMRERAQTEWKTCYETAYGVPLVYEKRGITSPAA